ncbi:MAG: DUF1572 family protein [Phycisphaerales bacterium JB039]
MAGSVIEAWQGIFRSQKSLIERAAAQLDDAQLHEPVAPETNPVSVILLHVAGSMRSRFTDWLTTDGEKPWRNREGEFDLAAARALSRDEIMSRWEASWRVLLEALAALSPADVDRTVRIRGEGHSVAEAIERQVSHYGYHAGQIVLIARILVQRSGGTWEHLSIPPGQTEAFNRAMRSRHGNF